MNEYTRQQSDGAQFTSTGRQTWTGPPTFIPPMPQPPNLQPLVTPILKPVVEPPVHDKRIALTSRDFPLSTP